MKQVSAACKKHIRLLSFARQILHVFNCLIRMFSEDAAIKQRKYTLIRYVYVVISYGLSA